MVTKRKILVVDDEKELVKLLIFNLSISGYDVLSANSGIEALEACELQNPDLIILDIMLPRIDGWGVCRRLKQNPHTSNIPIIMLSALSGLDEKLKGFDLGADDYITKPFSPRELIVRVKRVLSRSENRNLSTKNIKIGSLEIDGESMAAKRNNQEVFFTEKEKGILKLFINNPGRVLNHSKILDMVWGEDNIVEYGNIDVHIRHLREKIERDPENPRLIKTVKGEGYKFDA
ncbi:MAG: response regulator transcription factor [Candidatus Omnitrophica bacterium]|nr:response regulator transcription factor [Candidatus Omnitrophota bacterium]